MGETRHTPLLRQTNHIGDTNMKDVFILTDGLAIATLSILATLVTALALVA